MQFICASKLSWFSSQFSSLPCFWHFPSRSLIQLCLYSRINEFPCANSLSFPVEVGIISATPVCSTKGYWDVLIYLKCSNWSTPFPQNPDIDQPKTTLNGIHNTYTASHMQLPNEMRHMLGKCEHSVLICLAPTNAKKSSQYSSSLYRHLNVPTWAKLGLWGIRAIFISSIILCVVSIWNNLLKISWYKDYTYSILKCFSILASQSQSLLSSSSE